MKREIKFRAWDKENKEIRQVNGFDFVNGKVQLTDYTFYEWILGSRVELMQYTGLKDRNGKEIYEGDVVRKYREVNEAYGFDIHKVAWKPSAFVLLATDADNAWGGYLLYKTQEKLEVIGNIYSNPELAK